MLVVDLESRWRLITQSDHAHLAGRMAALWRTDGLPDHPRRDDVLFAAREHDNGWRELDAAPEWNAEEGRPHDFISWPGEERRDVWRRGVERYAAERPYAARLICRHALALHESERESGDPDSADLLAYLDAREADLAEETGVLAAEAARDYDWIAATDRFSLSVLLGWDEPRTKSFQGRTIRMETGGPGTLRLDPSPLAGSTSFNVPVRTVAKQDYGSSSALVTALLEARFESWAVRISGP